MFATLLSLVRYLLALLLACLLSRGGWTQRLRPLLLPRGKPGSKGFWLKRRPPAARRGIAKPTSVRKEVLRLAALTGAGCRTIERLFNRLHAARRKMSVGKSYVSYTIRNHRYEIEMLRKDIKHRPPRPVPRNDTWAVDMTGKGDGVGEIHSILGIEDHGTRGLLALEVLERRNAWTILGHLFLAMGRLGAPRAVRTDNESMFRSFVFRSIV